MKGNATCERKAEGCSVEINEDVTQPLSHEHGEGSRVQHGPTGKFTPICLWESQGLSEIPFLSTTVAMSPKVGFVFFFPSRKYKRLRGPRSGIPVCRSPTAAAGTAQPRVSPRCAEPERSWGHRRRNVEKRLLGVVSFLPGNPADLEPRGHRPRNSPQPGRVPHPRDGTRRIRGRSFSGTGITSGCSSPRLGWKRSTRRRRHQFN